jgi:hypothetical protein
VESSDKYKGTRMNRRGMTFAYWLVRSDSRVIADWIQHIDVQYIFGVTKGSGSDFVIPKNPVD